VFLERGFVMSVLLTELSFYLVVLCIAGVLFVSIYILRRVLPEGHNKRALAICFLLVPMIIGLVVGVFVFFCLSIFFWATDFGTYAFAGSMSRVVFYAATILIAGVILRRKSVFVQFLHNDN